jgi:hypothetical protein
MELRHGLLGVLSVLGVAPACQAEECSGSFDTPPVPDPSSSVPVVLDGEWIGAGVLELRFSAALSSIESPDPARFAILGWSAEFSEYQDCDPVTAYVSLMVGYYYGASVAEVWIAPEDDSILRMRLSTVAARCSIPTGSVGSGVMLVYTDGAQAGPALLDSDGAPLASIGPAWALDRMSSCGSGYCFTFFNYGANGHLPALDSLAPIPCP